MKKNNYYEKIKTELEKQNVRLEGFGTWLKIRESKAKLGIEVPKLGQFPYERKWERIYLQLKGKVDIDRFSDWLIGVPGRTRNVFISIEDGFTQIGNGLTQIGKYFGKIFHF